MGMTFTWNQSTINNMARCTTMVPEIHPSFFVFESILSRIDKRAVQGSGKQAGTFANEMRKRINDKYKDLPDELPALSVRQPFASMLAFGDKHIEVRTWNTNYRGPMVIVSGKMPHGGFATIVNGKNAETIPAADLLPSQPGREDSTIFPYGKTLAILNLVDVRPFKKSDVKDSFFTPSGECFAWVFEDDKIQLQQKPVYGKVGLFKVLTSFIME